MQRLTKILWSILNILIIVGLIAIILSCDEVLPPYQDPSDVFKLTISGEYAINQYENVLKVYLDVRNQYDEALQAKAVLRGKIKITWQRDTSIYKTAVLDSTNLFSYSDYNRITGTMTIRSGDSLRLRYLWDLKSDSGVDLTNLFNYETDPNCSQRLIADKETFLLEGEFKVFERTGIAQPTPGMLSFRYLNLWVGSAACIPVQ